MGEIFLVGVVILLLIVMVDEYLKVYDEWRDGLDDEDEL
jgi:hypothetical protein